MKTKGLLFSALLIIVLTGSVLISQGQYSNGWINNFSGVGIGNNIETQQHNGVAYSIVVELNSDQTFVVATDSTGVELWDYDFDENDPEGIVRKIKTTQHGLVVMGAEGLSLFSYNGVRLYSYDFSEEAALDDNGFFGGSNIGFDYSHRNVWETDTSLVFVGVMHDNTSETWTIHVKHANLTGGYHWEYEVLALSQSPIMSYAGSNSFTINHLDGNILNIYHMNLTSGSLGQFTELEDLVLPVTGDWIVLSKAEMDSERQHLLIYNTDAIIYYYSISFDDYSSAIFTYPKDFSNVHTTLNEFFSWLFTENYIFVSAGNEMLYRTDGLYTNLLTDGGSTMMEGSPRIIDFGNNLLVIYKDDDDKDTHILYYDQSLNLINSQIFSDYVGIESFMYGAVVGDKDDFYLYGYQRESWDPYVIYPSLSYWSGGELVSVSELITESDISIYPNPVSDYLTINSKDSDVQWELYTITGQEVMHGFEKQINVHQLSDGLYILKFRTAEGQIITEKILKQ